MTKGAEALSPQCARNITESRKVLYDKSASSADYVQCYEDYWAHTYNEDGTELGFQAWEYAISRLQKFAPAKDSEVLDYCGGTGQVGKRMAAAGYTNLTHTDGSSNMQKQAKELGVYKHYYTEVVDRNGKANFLQQGIKYDVILSSMSLSEFKPFVQQVFAEGLKKGGIFIAIESVPHLTMCELNGFEWIFEEAKNPNGCLEVLEDSDHEPHDTFTDHPCKVLVARKK